MVNKLSCQLFSPRFPVHLLVSMSVIFASIFLSLSQLCLPGFTSVRSPLIFVQQNYQVSYCKFVKWWFSIWCYGVRKVFKLFICKVLYVRFLCLFTVPVVKLSVLCICMQFWSVSPEFSSICQSSPSCSKVSLMLHFILSCFFKCTSEC